MNVVLLQESRQYTTLAFCAFKNHTQCFKKLLSHAVKHNPKESLSQWADTPTDEQFTALHFATYHANFELVTILVEQMGANFTLRNIYGANVLHVAA